MHAHKMYAIRHSYLIIILVVMYLCTVIVLMVNPNNRVYDNWDISE